METRAEQNQDNLQIDNVLSSQPELGPNIPDGGYGWVIVLASIFFHIVIPSISIGLGIFLLFSRIANGNSLETPLLWDNNMVYACLFFVTTATITSPLTRLLALTSTWPRLVATAGTCLTCGGILLIWTTTRTNNCFVFIMAGTCAGGGSSIILTQIDLLLLQYFKLKLQTINTIMYLSEAVGFIITPIALGHSIIQSDMHHIITWYQAVLLQGVIFSIAFKKPLYLKTAKQRYRLIRGLSDEEEDVFAKNSTELQNPRSSQSENAASSTQNPPSSTNVEARKVNTHNWQTFEEAPNKPTPARMELHKTFALEFHNDLDRINSFEDSYVTPTPLFSELHVNNNTSYSYEIATETDDPVVFMPNVQPAKESIWRKALFILKQPTFYKSLLFIITTKFSLFIFWTLFPTYLYIKIDNLHIHNTPHIIGCVSISSFIFSPFLNWVKSNRKLRPILFWIFCWLGAVGYLLFSDVGNMTILLFATIIVTLSINALKILGEPLMNINRYEELTLHYVFLCIISAICLLLFLVIDMEYKTCFRIMSMLQFLTGSLWLANFIYKRMKMLR